MTKKMQPFPGFRGFFHDLEWMYLKVGKEKEPIYYYWYLRIWKANYVIDTIQDLFDQVGHQTTYASNGNKHFFTKSCHHQTYQNFQSHFSASKTNEILQIFFEDLDF